MKKRSNSVVTPADEGMMAVRREGMVRDEDRFIFSLVSTHFLRKVMRGGVDLLLLAREELVNRHLDPDEHLR